MRFTTAAVSILAAGATAMPAVNTVGTYTGELIALEPLGLELPIEFIQYIEKHLPQTINNATGIVSIDKRDSCNWGQCLGTAASLAVTCAQALATRKGWDEAKCAASLVSLGSNIPAPCKACI